jgi:hypothetical protein
MDKLETKFNSLTPEEQEDGTLYFNLECKLYFI